MSRRLAPLAAVPLATLAVGGSAAAAPPPSPPQAAAPAPSTAQGITLCHEGFEIQFAPVREGAPADQIRAVVVLIGANDYGVVAGRAC